MKLESLVQVLCAAHLSSHVQSPFDGLGGVMLVGPPEAFKTTMLKALRVYPNALLVSDINTQQLAKMRDQIASGAIRSLALLDLQKIYERDPATAANVEGNLRALACEGFAGASFQSNEVNRVLARCVVMAAMTNSLVEKSFQRWKESGWARRFLFSTFVLDDPTIIIEAIIKWEPIDLGTKIIPPPVSGKIPMTVTEKERRHLNEIIRYQYGKAETLQTIVRIYAVLKWHYANINKPELAMGVIEDFGESLGREGSRLEIGETKSNGKRKQGKSGKIGRRKAPKGVRRSEEQISDNGGNPGGTGSAGGVD